eukprot:3328160-Rhodomonas_salina.1
MRPTHLRLARAGVTLTVSGDVVLQGSKHCPLSSFAMSGADHCSAATGAYEGCSIAVNGVCLVSAWNSRQPSHRYKVRQEAGLRLSLARSLSLSLSFSRSISLFSGMRCAVLTQRHQFTVGVAPETLRLTNLGDLEPGQSTPCLRVPPQPLWY